MNKARQFRRALFFTIHHDTKQVQHGQENSKKRGFPGEASFRRSLKKQGLGASAINAAVRQEARDAGFTGGRTTNSGPRKKKKASKAKKGGG